MRTVDLQRLDTVQLVPPTPFTPDGREVLPERLSEMVSALAGDGVSVFLPAAGTGEFHSLSGDEIVTCVRATRTAAGSESLVIAPIGFSVDAAVATGKAALDAGADGLLLMPVVHPYVADEGFRDYVEQIVRRVGCPLLTYKRGPMPTDRLLLEMARDNLLWGVKYAVNDLDAWARFAAAARRQSPFGLYCGTAERWAPFFMLAGATGYTSGAGCVAPKTTLTLHRHLVAGRYGDAFRLLDQLRPLEEYRARENDSYNIVSIKFAAQVRGWDCGPCRPPQRALSAGDQTALRAIVETLLRTERELPTPPAA